MSGNRRETLVGKLVDDMAQMNIGNHETPGIILDISNCLWGHQIEYTSSLVFTLQDGASIRDTGRDILFSVRSEAAREVALLYARKKWGRPTRLETNRIVRQELQDRAPEMER